MLDVNNFREDNTAQNMYFKKLLDILKILLKHLTFENIWNNDKIISNKQFIKKIDRWLKIQLDDKNNKFIYKSKFLNVRTATSQAKFGFVYLLLKNYCLKYYVRIKNVFINITLNPF